MLAGLELYGQEYVKLRFDASFLEFSAVIENKAKSLIEDAVLDRDAYMAKHAKDALLFVLEVQKWKMLYVDEQYDVFAVCRASEIAGAIYDFQKAETPADQLSHFLRITSRGVGLCEDSWCRKLNRALSIARFLDPLHWALIDWRILGVLGYSTMTDLKQERIGSSVEQIRHRFEPINYLDLEMALQLIQECRCDDLPRAVDVELALYAISLDIWRAGLARENLRRVYA